MTEFDKVIRPGGVGKVVASIDTSHLKGTVTKSVTVTTNDPALPTTSLSVKADIKVAIDIQPSEQARFQGRVGSLQPQELTLVSTEGTPFDVLTAQPNNGNVTVTVTAAPGEKSTQKAGALAAGATKYVVTVTPAAALPIGFTSGAISMTTSHPKMADFVVSWTAQVTGNILVQPERVMISVPQAPPAAGVTQNVVLRKAPESKRPLEVKTATSSDARVTVKSTTTRPGEEVSVAITYTGPAPVSSTVANVTIETGDDLQPTLTIPVYVRAAAQAGQPMQITPTITR